ncbi:MAG: hypothetical protein WBJ62_04860 [Coriobacteriia bacterium]
MNPVSPYDALIDNGTWMLAEQCGQTYPAEPQIIFRFRSELKQKLDVYQRYVKRGTLDPAETRRPVTR